MILPGLLPFEESHYDVAFPQLSYRNHARYSSPVLAPPPIPPVPPVPPVQPRVPVEERLGAAHGVEQALELPVRRRG